MAKASIKLRVDFVPASFLKLRYRIYTSQGMQIKNVKELL